MQQRKSHRFLRPIVVAASIALTLAVTAGRFADAAVAATIPYHEYTINCPKMGYWGNRIKANPIRIDTQAGVGQSIVDGTGIYRPTTQQYVYFELWAYSYKFGQWYHSDPKRVLNGFVGTVEAYDARAGYWKAADAGFANSDLAVGPNEVAINPATGSGTWKIEVQTYWAPAVVNITASDLTNPSAPTGGLNIFDVASTTCTF